MALFAAANQVNNLICGWQPAGLFLGINSLTVDENVQGPWPTQANTSWYSKFAFDALFQAHGLHLDIPSKETALDFDSHT